MLRDDDVTLSMRLAMLGDDVTFSMMLAMLRDDVVTFSKRCNGQR